MKRKHINNNTSSPIQSQQKLKFEENPLFLVLTISIPPLLGSLSHRKVKGHPLYLLTFSPSASCFNYIHGWHPNLWWSLQLPIPSYHKAVSLNLKITKVYGILHGYPDLAVIDVFSHICRWQSRCLPCLCCSLFSRLRMNTLE